MAEEIEYKSLNEAAPAAPAGYNLAGKYVPVIDPTQPEETQVKKVSATEFIGASGTSGTNGWSPVTAKVQRGTGPDYAVVNQIVDWTGGTGTKPAVGMYEGPAGWVTDINEATNVRGPEGTGGSLTPEQEALLEDMPRRNPRTFDIRDYGGKCDRMFVKTAYVVGNVVTSEVSAFTSEDVGKLIKLVNPGPETGYTHVTTIASVTAPGSIIITDEAPEAPVSLVYGSNDLAAMRAVRDACAAPDEFGRRGGTILCGNSILFGENEAGCNGLIKIPLTFTEPAHLGIVNNYGYFFKGYGPIRLGDYGDMNQGVVSPQQGAIIESFSAQAGWIIDPEVATYGFGTGNYAYLFGENLVFRNIYGGEMSGINGFSLLGGMALSYVVADVDRPNPFNPPAAGTIGISWPQYNNNTVSVANNVMAYGYEAGHEISEHLTGTLYSFTCLHGITTRNAGHALHIDKAITQWCKHPIHAIEGVNITIDMLIIEREQGEDFWYYTEADIYDPGNVLVGEVTIANSGKGPAGKVPMIVGGGNLTVKTTGNTGWYVDRPVRSVSDVIYSRVVGQNAQAQGHPTSTWGTNDPNRSGSMLILPAADAIGQEYARGGTMVFKRGFTQLPSASNPPTGDFTFDFCGDFSTVNWAFNYDQGGNKNVKGGVFIGNAKESTEVTPPTGAILIQSVDSAARITAANGIILPRMTKVQRDAIASPAPGTAIYQTDNTPGMRMYNGTSWMRFTETAD